MPLLNHEDKAAKATATALTYITIGSILAILAGTSFFFFTGPFDENRLLGYIRVATLLIGLVLLGIGLTLGHIAKSARAATIAENEANATSRPAGQPQQSRVG